MGFTIASRIVGLSIGAMLITAESRLALAQPSTTTAPRLAWDVVDRYYAAFAAMTRDPRGAMDPWLDFYDDSVLFVDPTANLSATGRDTIRTTYLNYFTSIGGPSSFTVLRRAHAGDWMAVEGTLEGLQRGKRIEARFSTWFRFRAGRIVHQIDYLDYASIRRQVRDSVVVAPTPPLGEPRAMGDPPASARALRQIVDSFFAHYNRVAVDSMRAIDRMFALLGDPFQLEDPTAAARFVGPRADYHAALSKTILQNRWGPDTRWEVDRIAMEHDWAAVEGTFLGTLNDSPFAARFTTWLRVRGGRIVHQIDYLDYRPLRHLLR